MIWQCACPLVPWSSHNLPCTSRILTVSTIDVDEQRKNGRRDHRELLPERFIIFLRNSMRRIFCVLPYQFFRFIQDILKILSLLTWWATSSTAFFSFLTFFDSIVQKSRKSTVMKRSRMITSDWVITGQTRDGQDSLIFVHFLAYQTVEWPGDEFPSIIAIINVVV